MGRSRYRGASGTPRTVYWAAISNNLVTSGRAAYLTTINNLGLPTWEVPEQDSPLPVVFCTAI